MTSTPTNKRNDGIDLLRCILMFGVVLHHCCCHTSFQSNTLSQILFLFTIPFVDSFIAISGWFGIRFSIRKIFRIIIQIGICSSVLSLCSILFVRLGIFQEYYISPGVGWFGVCYIALLILAPIADLLLSTITKTRSGQILSFAILSIILLAWQFIPASCISFVIISGSHSTGTLLIVYLLTRHLRYFSFVCNVKRYVPPLLVLSWLFYLVPATTGMANGRTGLTCLPGFYAFPAVMVFSALLPQSFASLSNLPVAVSRLVRFITPSLFSVYLLHDAHAFGRKIFIYLPNSFLSCRFNIGSAHDFGIWSVTVPLIWALIVFVTTIMIDLVIRRIPTLLLNKITAGSPLPLPRRTARAASPVRRSDKTSSLDI